MPHVLFCGGTGPDGNIPPRQGDESPNSDDEPVLDPNNPLYARIRAALSKQLADQQVRVTDELREKDEGLRRLKKKKEDVGVELYGVQQQLARMQIMLERTHENFNSVRQFREEAEKEIKSAIKEYDKKKLEVAEQEKRIAKFQAELDKLNSTLLQVEQYNDKMKSEIGITRRATYKAEEQVRAYLFTQHPLSWCPRISHRLSHQGFHQGSIHPAGLLALRSFVQIRKFCS